MIGQDTIDNTVVILSDDEGEEEKHIINENGKRVYYYGTEEQGSEDEEEFEEEYEEGEVVYEDEDEVEDEEYEYLVRLSQVLPEEHESAIFSERDQENPLQPLNDIFNSLKSHVLKSDLSKDEVKTSFAIGLFAKSDAPSVAMNVEGVAGPIAFPIINKDANLIISAHSKQAKDVSCFGLKTSQILLNQSFQEYIYQIILPDIYARLGVNQHVIDNSRLEAIQLFICKEGNKLELPKQHPKGSYGSALIILPSDFGGGAIEACYYKVSTQFRPETESYDGFYYMAWYNDVEIITEPIIYGNQVSVYFSLIYGADNELIDCTYLQNERRINEAGELLPNVANDSKSYLDAISSYLTLIPTNTKYPIFYMLNYSYNYSSIRVHDLKKSDKLIFNLVKRAAEESNYSLYIASVSREVEASVIKRSINKDDKNKIDNDKDCAMDEEGIYLSENIIDDTLILTTLNDENGVNQLAKPIPINFKKHHPIIQGNLWYSRCKPDSEDYSGSRSVKEASVTYFYSNNTAIALIPKTDTSLLKEPTQLSN